MAGVRSAAAEGPLAQGRRRDPARRDRQAADEPAAVELPARRRALRGARRRGRARPRRADGPHRSACVDERIIREITPIFDTRALGYDSMLVAAKVDAENPHRAAKIINSHPGVSHNYLRTHEFNLWFTIATPPDSELGLAGHARGPAAAHRRRVDPPAADAEAVQDQHEPGDGEGHRGPRRGRRGGAAARARAPALRRHRHRRDPRAPGPDGGRRPPLRRGRGRGRDEHRRRCLDHLRGMVERKILRRVAAILYHRRAGFSANGMGVWKVPDERDPRGRHADGRGARDLALLRAPDLRGLALLGLHDGPRPLEGGVRRDPRSRSPTSTTCTARTARRSTPRPSSRRSACTTSPTTTRSGKRRTPRPAGGRSAGHARVGGALRPRGGPAAGRRQLAGPRDALDRPRVPDLHRARRGLRADRRRRQPLRRLGLLLGAADPRPRRPGGRRGGRARPPARGTSYGAPTEGEVELAAEVCDRFASVEMMRMVNSGTEATMSAVRLARAATGREQLVKFAGAYHGHVDGLLAEAGSGLATQGIPASPGVPEAQAAATIVVALERPRGGRGGARRARGGGDPRRADPGEHGRRPARRRASSRELRGWPTSTARCSSSTR